MAEGTSKKEHPLLNALVLSQLFNYSHDFQTLTQSRAVCQDWHKATFKQWRSSVGVLRLGRHPDPNSNGNIAVSPGTSAAAQGTNFQRSNGWPIEHFLKICTQDTPLSQGEEYFIHWRDQQLPTGFVLCDFNLKSDCSPVVHLYDSVIDSIPPNVLNFWQILGSTITYIHFDHCQFQGSYQYLFEKMITEKLSNLQSLKLTDCQIVPEKPQRLDSRIYMNSTWRSEMRSCQLGVTRNHNLRKIYICGPSPMCFYQLLMLAPNLEELTISTKLNWKIKDYRFWPFYKTVNHIRHALDRGHFPLKHLDIMDTIMFDKKPFHGRLNRWRNMVLNLPLLEHLAVTVYLHDYKNINFWPRRGWNFENGEDLERMLVPHIQARRRTLKTLKVFRPPMFPCPPESPFQMEMLELKELYLYGNIIRSFAFLRNMPNLKVLYVDFRCYEQLDKLQALFYPEGGRMALGKFRSMYQPWQQATTLTNPAIRWPFMMGQLERFHYDGPMNQKLLERMGDFMPCLKVLEVVADSLVFEGICGWLPGLEELILLCGSKIDDETLTGLTKDGEMRNPKNLTALKSLTRFEMRKVLCDSAQGRLGNKSVYEGFLKMDRLKSVKVCVADEMSAETESALIGHVANVEVIRKHCANQHKTCCRLNKFSTQVLNVVEVEIPM